MSVLSFENSIPSHKSYGENRIVNRECLVKQCATSALWVERIIIPDANNSENSIVNRGGIAKYSKETSYHHESEGRYSTKYL